MKIGDPQARAAQSGNGDRAVAHQRATTSFQAYLQAADQGDWAPGVIASQIVSIAGPGIVHGRQRPDVVAAPVQRAVARRTDDPVAHAVDHVRRHVTDDQERPIEARRSGGKTTTSQVQVHANVIRTNIGYTGGDAAMVLPVPGSATVMAYPGGRATLFVMFPGVEEAKTATQEAVAARVATGAPRTTRAASATTNTGEDAVAGARTLVPPASTRASPAATPAPMAVVVNAQAGGQLAIGIRVPGMTSADVVQLLEKLRVELATGACARADLVLNGQYHAVFGAGRNPGR